MHVSVQSCVSLLRRSGPSLYYIIFGIEGGGRLGGDRKMQILEILVNIGSTGVIIVYQCKRAKSKDDTVSKRFTRD